MELFDGIFTRKSVDRFSARTVDRATLLQLVRAGSCAATGLDNRPWRFALVLDAGLCLRIGGLRPGNGPLVEAPAYILVFVDYGAMCHFTLDYQAVGACLQNMFLAAQALGLGMIWNGRYLERAGHLQRLLGVADNLELMAVLAVGYPCNAVNIRRRPRLAQLLIRET
jgi:nitroreductase